MLVFKSVWKEAHKKERLNKTAKWSDKILIGILLGLEAFWESRADIKCQLVTEKQSSCLLEGGFHKIPLKSIWMRTVYSAPTFRKQLFKVFQISKGLVTILFLPDMEEGDKWILNFEYLFKYSWSYLDCH